MPPTPPPYFLDILLLFQLPHSIQTLQKVIHQSVTCNNTPPSKFIIGVSLPSNTSSANGFYTVEKIVNKLYSITAVYTNIDFTVLLFSTREDEGGGIVNSVAGVKEYISSLSEIKNGNRKLRNVFINGQYDGFGESMGDSWSVGRINQIDERDGDDDWRVWWDDGGRRGDGGENGVVALGGTFDYLHAGHKLLLTMALYLLSVSRTETPTLIIGLTGSDLLKNKKHKEFVTSFETRRDGVLEFLRSLISPSSSTSEIKPTDEQSSLPTTTRISKYILQSKIPINVEIHEIQDPAGPTITMKEITGLVVTEETVSGGDSINKKRKEMGWDELEVFVVGLIGGDGSVEGKLSSTEIRRRLAEGRV